MNKNFHNMIKNIQSKPDNTFTEQENKENQKNFTKSGAIFDKYCLNMSKHSKDDMWEIAKDTNLNIYIKTLLEAYRTLPNILKILDQIIEKRASGAVMACSGFFSNTFDEIDKVIELSERKDKLLNLYVIADTMLNMLSDSQRKFAILKFVKKRSADHISEELGINKRSVYRSANSVIKTLCIKMLERNWTSDFIALQIGKNEPWLDDIFCRKLEEEKTNAVRAFKNMKQTQPEYLEEEISLEDNL